MRIGVIAPPWIPVPPPAYGGIEEVVDVLARGLAALGNEVVLAAGTGSTCPVERIPALSFPPGAIGDKRQELAHVAHAYTELWDRDVDIVHDHTLAGPVFRHRPGVPIVATVHGPFLPYMRRLFASVPPEVAVVAISHHQASTAGEVTVGRVIHHGIDASAIRPGAGQGGYLAFLGRMTPTKGVLEAIEVARMAGIPLCIAAKMREPAEREYFDRAIRPQLAADVEFLGEVAMNEKFDFLGEAIALINPIQWPEPFGMVMIEAMAVGTPVVTMPRGSAPEIVDEGVTGYVRGTLAGLAAAVLEATALDRTRIRASLERHFSMERMAGDYDSYFGQLVGAQSAGAQPVSGRGGVQPEEEPPRAG